MLHTLYNGEIELDFDEDKHVYTVDGEVVPSVTGITKVINKPALVPWAAKVTADYFKDQIEPGKGYDEVELEAIYTEAKAANRKVASQAAGIGNIVHKFCEDTVNGLEPKMPVNMAAQKGCKAFLKWIEEHDVVFLSSEFKVYSRIHEVAGTCDLDCIIDGKRTIADFKTSSGVYPEMHIQTAAYCEFKEEEERKDLYSQRAIILLNKKTGEFDVSYRNMEDEYAIDFAAFKGALWIYAQQLTCAKRVPEKKKGWLKRMIDSVLNKLRRKK